MLVIAAAAVALQVVAGSPATITASVDAAVARSLPMLAPSREIHAPSKLWVLAPFACHTVDGLSAALASSNPRFREQNPTIRRAFEDGQHAQVVATKMAIGAGMSLVTKLLGSWSVLGKGAPAVAKAFSAGQCGIAGYGIATNVYYGAR